MSDLAAFGLGALAAVFWLAALLLDFLTMRVPGWVREAPHAALVLAVPALIALIGRKRRLGVPRTALALLAIVIAALPGLLLVAQAQDLASLPLRIPTLGLGVALGYVAPNRYGLPATQHAAGAAQRGWSAAAAGGVGFALLLVPAGVVLVTAALAAAVPACRPSPAQIDCGPGGSGPGMEITLELAICGTTLLTLLLALGASAPGGRAIARLRGPAHS